MKPPVVLLCLLLASASGLSLNSAPAVSNQTDRAEFAGRPYLRLGDWAGRNNFDIRWLVRDETLQLTNRYCRLVFQKDSAGMEFNGINVLLSFPVVVHDGAGYLAEADLKNTLYPLLSPPGGTNGPRIKNIVIDPGHGGKDPGFQVGSYQEKKYTLLLAQELRDQLKRAGFNVSLTRTGDTFVDLASRPELARRRGADLFISLHWNSAGTGGNEVRGVQTYCLTPAGAPSSNSGDDTSGAEAKPGNRNDAKNLLLAYKLQQALLRELGIEDHGVRRARYLVLCEATMPAILIEGGYMSNPAESKRIYDAGYRKQMAQAIVDGVLAYRRQVEPPPVTPTKPIVTKSATSSSIPASAGSQKSSGH